MHDFNFVEAWFKLAWPGVQSLSPQIRALFLDIREDLKELRQGSDLNIPATPEMFGRFEMFDSKELARASRALNFYGHWSPFPALGNGCWKFSNVADQVLRKRLLGTASQDGKELVKNCRVTIFIRIYEGVCRVCVSSDTRGSDYWVWEEVALAEAPLPESEIVEQFQSQLSREGLPCHIAQKILQRLRKKFGSGLWDTSSFYGTREATDLSMAAAKKMPDSGWEVLKKD